MTRLLEQAFEAARVASPEIQDELARVLLSYLGSEGPGEFALSDDDLAFVKQSRDAFARGDVATDEEMTALWAKHGL